MRGFEQPLPWNRVGWKGAVEIAIAVVFLGPQITWVLLAVIIVTHLALRYQPKTREQGPVQSGPLPATTLH